MSAPAPPDPVRRAFARIEAWKAACLILVLLASVLPSRRVYHDTMGTQLRRLDEPQWRGGWDVLRRSPQLPSVLPWILVKAFAAHVLLAYWFRRQATARLTATETLLTWGLSTALDAFILWAGTSALVDYYTPIGNPLAWDHFGARRQVEHLITATSLSFAEGWLGLGVIAFALGPYMLFRAMRERSRVETLGQVETPPPSPPRLPRARIAVLCVALSVFLALPWIATRRLGGWRASEPSMTRAPGLTHLLGDFGGWQRDGAGLMAIGILALIGTAWIGRTSVNPRDRGTYAAVLCSEIVCLLAWGVGYALLAFPPYEWLRPSMWERVTEVAPFLNAQLLLLCALETVWFAARRPSTDITDEHP